MTYPSEKWWSSSMGLGWHRIYEMEVIKFHGSKPPTSHRKSPFFIAKPSIPSSVIKHGKQENHRTFSGGRFYPASHVSWHWKCRSNFYELPEHRAIHEIHGGSSNESQVVAVDPGYGNPHTTHSADSPSPMILQVPTLMIFREQIQSRLHGIFRRIFTIWFHP